ncbi:hypothetical protein ACI78R_07315 [Geodermatophilus sp. SYSU D01106]
MQHDDPVWTAWSEAAALAAAALDRADETWRRAWVDAVAAAVPASAMAPARPWQLRARRRAHLQRAAVFGVDPLRDPVPAWSRAVDMARIRAALATERPAGPVGLAELPSLRLPEVAVRGLPVPLDAAAADLAERVRIWDAEVRAVLAGV